MDHAEYAPLPGSKANDSQSHPERYKHTDSPAMKANKISQGHPGRSQIPYSTGCQPPSTCNILTTKPDEVDPIQVKST
jgi:hypothetical protein